MYRNLRPNVLASLFPPGNLKGIYYIAMNTGNLFKPKWISHSADHKHQMEQFGSPCSMRIQEITFSNHLFRIDIDSIPFYYI